MQKTKKISSFLVVFILLLSVFPVVSKADTSNNVVQNVDVNTAVVTSNDGTDSVNLLTEDSNNSTILTSIPNSTEVTILEKGSAYTKITFKDPTTGKTWTGYVNNDSLKNPTQTNTAVNQENHTSQTVQPESTQKAGSQSSTDNTNQASSTPIQSKSVRTNTRAIVAKASVDTPYQSRLGVALNTTTNIYAAQDLNATILKGYVQGTILKYNVPVVAWYECTVFINGVATTGYINSSDVKITDYSQPYLVGIGISSPTNVYSQPSTDSEVLRSYSQNATLKFKKPTYDWFSCTVIINGNATTGYINANDVETIVDLQQSKQGIGLNSPTAIYSKASTNAKILRNYDEGTILKYKTFTSEWFVCTIYIKGKATSGYIHLNDVESITNSPKTVRGIGKYTLMNIYSKASTSSKALKSYAQGTVLKYKTFTSDWYAATVYINGQARTGYIDASDVENAVSPQQSMQGIAQKSPTSIYSSANTSSKKLKSYSKYTILSYKTFTSNWYECKVYVNGVSKNGYIRKSDVSIKKTVDYELTLDDAVAMQMKVSPKADGAGTIKATADQVAYYMDPNNFSEDSSDYYQFLILSSYAGTVASELNNNILKGKGILAGHGQAFITAAKKYNISELYLISHSLLETGNGTSQLATGVKINGTTVYNVYGIGAYDSNPTHDGAQYAYDNGWTSIDKAIIEGAQFVSTNYINNGQDTLYKMRWNPDAMVALDRANHQYATDVGWAVKQTTTLSLLYNQLTKFTLLYEVPEYIF